MLAATEYRSWKMWSARPCAARGLSFRVLAFSDLCAGDKIHPAPSNVSLALQGQPCKRSCMLKDDIACKSQQQHCNRTTPKNRESDLPEDQRMGTGELEQREYIWKLSLATSGPVLTIRCQATKQHKFHIIYIYLDIDWTSIRTGFAIQLAQQRF